MALYGDHASGGEHYDRAVELCRHFYSLRQYGPLRGTQDADLRSPYEIADARLGEEKDLRPGQEFAKAEVVNWFKKNYPNIRPTTVRMHVDGMSVNNRNRKHYPNVKEGSGHDLFFKIGSDRFRLWDSQIDPPPLYKADIEATDNEFSPPTGISEAAEQVVAEAAAREFAFEKDLQNYLVKNLEAVEPGLRLYEDEGITGLEFEVGGRFIDILAVDKNGGYVIVELKVSRGYDRVIGQILRYMAWVDQNLGGGHPARGIIVAHEITDDLKLATSLIPGVRLIEYQISFKLTPM